MADTAATLALGRYFTEEGTHPYDMLTWVERDSKIVSPGSGKTVFEQKRVEFPDSWSQNAVNIVSLYFHNVHRAVFFARSLSFRRES